MTDEETARMNDLARKLADTAIDYKKRCEELEAKLWKLEGKLDGCRVIIASQRGAEERFRDTLATATSALVKISLGVKDPSVFASQTILELTDQGHRTVKRITPQTEC
jgi:hypothetical protein